MRSPETSPRSAWALALALVCAACFNPAGGDLTATSNSATATGTSTGTASTSLAPSTSGSGLTSSGEVTTAPAVTTGASTTDVSTTSASTTGASTGATTSDTAAEPECGDGTLDPGEQCDDGNGIDGDGCSGACESEEHGTRLIFLTSQKYLPQDLNTVSGANARCQLLADSAEALPELHDRSWVAWLSDGDVDARDQIGFFAGDYILPDEHLVVARGSAGLTSGALLAPIREDEKGVAAPSDVPCNQNPDDPVWTGTDFNGTAVDDMHCSNWKADIGEGVMGVYAATDATWTRCLPRDCGITARLYCVEI